MIDTKTGPSGDGGDYIGAVGRRFNQRAHARCYGMRKRSLSAAVPRAGSSSMQIRVRRMGFKRTPYSPMELISIMKISWCSIVVRYYL